MRSLVFLMVGFVLSAGASAEGNGSSLTLGHHWPVRQLPAAPLGTVSEMKAVAEGGALKFVTEQTPTRLDLLDPPPRWGASFALADGRPLIELQPGCDVLVFGKFVEHDCAPLAAFGAWVTSVDPRMVPRPGAYFRAAPGKGVGGGTDGNLYLLAGDFSLTFYSSGRARVVMGETTSTTLYDSAFSLVVYDAFRHWLALSTANHQLERVVGDGTALKPLFKRGQPCCDAGKRVKRSECSVVSCGGKK